MKHMQIQQADFPFEIPSKEVIRKRIKESFTQKKERESQQSERLYYYLRKIREFPSLNIKEKNRLWKQMKECERYKRVEEKLVSIYSKKVILVAKRYKDNPYHTLLELILAGTKELRKAIRSIRWKTKQKFPSHYLVWWIRKGISDAIRKKRRLLLYGEDVEIFIWKDENGNITDINFCCSENGRHAYGMYKGTIKQTTIWPKDYRSAEGTS